MTTPETETGQSRGNGNGSVPAICQLSAWKRVSPGYLETGQSRLFVNFRLVTWPVGPILPHGLARVFGLCKTHHHYSPRGRQKPAPNAWTKPTRIEFPRAFSPTCSKHHIVGRCSWPNPTRNRSLQTSLKLVFATPLQGILNESQRL